MYLKVKMYNIRGAAIRWQVPDFDFRSDGKIMFAFLAFACQNGPLKRFTLKI